MGLFSNTKVDSSIASLFGSKNNRDDILKQREQESTLNTSKRPAPKLDDSDNEEEEIPAVKSSEDKNEAEPDLEDVYVRKAARKQTESKEEDAKKVKVNELEGEEEIVHNDEDSESSDEEEETTKTSSSSTSKEERGDSVDDNLNTVFVKNVPNQVITDRKAFKEFKKIFGPDVKSIRFRSIAMSEIVPRKVAFIKQKLHPARDAVNSYIVYKNRDRVFEVINSMNGHEFLEHHLFVDNAAKPRAQANNRSVFIGNLNFEASEEDLYRHFADCGEIENLRIVRDRKVNLGKGFAYVQFADVSTVQLALLKNGQELDGRKLRVTRCSKQRQQQSKAANNTDKSFRQKQTERSKKGNPRREQRAKANNTEGTTRVLEGMRAKTGDTVDFGRKRKPRHDNARGGSNAKKAKKSRS